MSEKMKQERELYRKDVEEKRVMRSDECVDFDDYEEERK